ncbi:MAG: TetR/AcrR family transcriptional regulator [Chloroflexi bacterium]|nr:TetR/AcrR family transcriptional regulator [Chloroflexota bacterium]MCA2001039.1 TetR/AcrR family transcriptional regulator [Chloroflexota bacterium]
MREKKYHHGDLKNALIEAGIKILSEEGTGGLTLRKVAKLAGVSHSAPYAHFADKQSLIAAISTEGFKRLYAELDAAILANADNPRRQLMEGARAYVQFAMNNIGAFKVMFSSALEKEKDYPSFVEISHKTFERVVDIVKACQAAGALRPAPPEVMAVAVWGQLHGIISLILEGQISHTVLDKFNVWEIVSISVEQVLSSGAPA